MAKSTSRKTAARPVVAGKTTTQAAGTTATATVTATDVAVRAYGIYLEEGQPDGRHLEHWLRAEAELRA